MIRKTIAILLILLFSSLNNSAWSQPFTTIVFSNAIPIIQMAGQTVHIRVGLVNSGTVPWGIGEYAITIDLFRDGTFIFATPPFQGTSPVRLGETVILYVPVDLPSDFRGEYQYRVRFLFKDQPLVISEPRYSFRVVERLTEAPKFKQEVHGDTSTNWLYDEANGGRATGTTNLTAKLSPQSSLSFYGFTDQNAQTSTNHLDFYGPSTQAKLGYHYGDLSELAFNGSSGPGVGVTQQIGKGKLQLHNMRIQKPREGSPFSNGAYERALWAQKFSVPLGRKVEVGFLSLHSYDKTDSIVTPGPTLTAASNDALATDLVWRFSPYVSFQGLYGTSVLDDRSRGIEPLQDRAWKMRLRANNRDYSLSFDGSFYKTGLDYFSFGAPGLVNDRRGYELGGNWRTSQKLSMQAAFSGYHNNIRANSALARLSNDNMILGASYSLAPATQLMLNYSRNGFQTTGSTSPTENRTWNTSVSLSHAMSNGLNFSTNWFFSEFRDYTNLSPELSTQSSNFNLSKTFRNQSTISLSHNINTSTNLRTDIASVNRFSSLNWNYYIIPDRFLALVGLSQNTSKNVPFTDSVNDLVSLGFAYKLWRNHILGFGWTWNQMEDKVTSQNSFKNRAFNMNYNTRF